MIFGVEPCSLCGFVFRVYAIESQKIEEIEGHLAPRNFRWIFRFFAKNAYLVACFYELRRAFVCHKHGKSRSNCEQYQSKTIKSGHKLYIQLRNHGDQRGQHPQMGLLGQRHVWPLEGSVRWTDGVVPIWKPISLARSTVLTFFDVGPYMTRQKLIYRGLFHPRGPS